MRHYRTRNDGSLTHHLVDIELTNDEILILEVTRHKFLQRLATSE